MPTLVAMSALSQPARLLIAAIIAVGLLGLSCGSARADRYGDCVALLETDAAAAFDDAIAWRDLGGGGPARHCAALALVGLELYAEAAERFEALARDMTAAPPDVRTRVLAQGGQPRIAAEDYAGAVATLSAALELAPVDAELFVDRAQALAGAANYLSAIGDLDRAIELAPDHIDARVFRATAYRMVDAPELAHEDLKVALAAEPGHIDALLERGNLRRLQGDAPGARADWLTVLLHAPDGPAADAARLNLEQLDLNPEAVQTP